MTSFSRRFTFIDDGIYDYGPFRLYWQRLSDMWLVRKRNTMDWPIAFNNLPVLELAARLDALEAAR